MRYSYSPEPTADYDSTHLDYKSEHTYFLKECLNIAHYGFIVSEILFNR